MPQGTSLHRRVYYQWLIILISVIVYLSLWNNQFPTTPANLEIDSPSIIVLSGKNSSSATFVSPLKETGTEEARRPLPEREHDDSMIAASAAANHASFSLFEKQANMQWQFPVATTVSTNATRVIAMLSMGLAAAQSTLVERALISIRKPKRGAYLGPVLILTDVPARYQSLTRKDPNLIVLQPLAKDWRWDLKRDMPYKRFKTFLLEYLNLDDRLESVQRVYYLDIDIVVGRSLQNWFDHVEQTYWKNNTAAITSMNSGSTSTSTSAGTSTSTSTPTTTATSSNASSSSSSSQMILFQGNYDYNPLQGGQFLLERKSSQPCLERWRYYIDANPQEHKDQPALTQMWKESHGDSSSSSSHYNNRTSSPDCQLTAMPHSPHLHFLSQNAMERFVRSQTYPTLMHIKNTHHANMISDKLQKTFFRQLLDLSPEEVQAITGKRRIRPNRTWSAIQVGHYNSI